MNMEQHEKEYIHGQCKTCNTNIGQLCIVCNNCGNHCICNDNVMVK